MKEYDDPPAGHKIARMLYGRPNSINVQKVRWTLAELGLEYRHVESGRQHEEHTRDPWFLKLNPNGTVPVLVEGDGVTVWESNAAVRYLAAQYDEGGLWPRDAGRRADTDKWMDWQQTTLLPAFNPAFWQLIRTPADRRDETVVAACVEKANAAFGLLDRELDKRAFIAGEQLTMGDIPLGCCAYRWFNLPMQRASVPNVEAWYARLQEREAFRTNVMIPLS